MAAMDPERLVGYCGLYCEACRIRQGKVKEAVNNLRGIITTYGFDRAMPDLARWEPAFKHYDEFTQVMDGLERMFGYCPGCRDNGGDPNCQVRQCAGQKGFRVCTECSEAESCQKLEPYRKYFNAALQSIKANGLRGYAANMQKKVDEGYAFP